MTLTSLLNDNTLGDTSTGEITSVSQEVNSRPTLSLLSVNVVFVAPIYLETSHALTAATAKVVATRDTTAVGSECVSGEGSPVADADSGAWSLQAWDGAAWVEVDSGALSVVSMGEGSQTTSISASFTSVTSCWLRLEISYALEYVTCEGALSGSLQVTDFRFTGTSTGLACAEGSDGLGGLDGTLGLIDEFTYANCGCDANRPAPVQGSAARVASASSSASRPAPLASTADRPTCAEIIYYLVDDDGAYLVDDDGAFLTDGES